MTKKGYCSEQILKISEQFEKNVIVLKNKNVSEQFVKKIDCSEIKNYFRIN